jgi:hypothetical protein
MYEDLSSLLEGLLLKIVVLKFVDNSFKNNKVIAQNGKNQAKFRHLTLKVKVINE